MNNKLSQASLTIAIILALVLASVAGWQFYHRHVNRSESTIISYAIGFQIGHNLKRQKVTADPHVVAQAIDDVLAGRAPRFTVAQMQVAMDQVRTQAQKKMQDEANNNLLQGVAFLKANAQKPGVKIDKSGIQYQVVKIGSGRMPNKNSTIVVNYEGRLLNGQVFDSTRQKGKPAVFKMSQILPGLAKGISLMREHSIYRFFLPPGLAYGASARPGIPPQSVLIFEVELLKVK